MKIYTVRDNVVLSAKAEADFMSVMHDVSNWEVRYNPSYAFASERPELEKSVTMTGTSSQQ